MAEDRTCRTCGIEAVPGVRAKVLECGDLSPLWVSNSSKQLNDCLLIQTRLKSKAVTGPRIPKVTFALISCNTLRVNKSGILWPKIELAVLVASRPFRAFE